MSSAELHFSRSHRRHGLDLPIRTMLLEEDADKAERSVQEIEAQLADAIRRIDTRVSRLMWALVSAAITFAGATLMLALNLAVLSP
jgi:hypothetical protein